MGGTVDQIIKHSVLYSYLLSQPFTASIDTNIHLNKGKPLAYNQHDEIVRLIESKFAIGDIEEINNMYQVESPDSIVELINIEKVAHMIQIKNISPTIYVGVHDENIALVQESLQYFDLYKGEVDGIYGPLTKDALEKMEEEYDISLIYEEIHEELVEETPLPAKEMPVQTKEIQSVSKEHDVTSTIISEARELIGTPYVWGGDSPGGFDCSGFTQFVYDTQDITIPRTVADTWNFATPVDTPSVGDLVFFETYQPGPSHMGIYLGDNKFIHAGTSNGVTISQLDTSYWQEKYIGAKRIEVN